MAKSRQRKRPSSRTARGLNPGFGTREMFVLTTPGLEEALADELADLGLHGRMDKGGIAIDAGAITMRAIHLYSRVASSVRIRVTRGRAENLEDVGRVARAGAWKSFIHPNQPVKVAVANSGSRFRHRAPVAKKVEIAIRDALRGPRLPGPRPPREEAVVHVRLVEGKVIISMEASGEPLNKRGWRREAGRAPIRENIAAAMLRLADWNPGEALVDPMCGSGTFPIEAATIAMGRASGARRSFNFERFPCHDAKAFKKERAEASTGVLDASAPIVGGDRDEGVIAAALKNARRAEVDDRVELRQSTFQELEPPCESGLIICNPPYGERVSKKSVIGAMYRDLGRAMRAEWSGWRIAILLPTARTKDALDLPVEEITRFKNGSLSVVLYVGSIP
ncbi:MAG: hypothetical protein KC912_07990 [Proteobacteria bacterium]|nr:hypothetical protein [Pseudomonadota bacterium]